MSLGPAACRSFPLLALLLLAACATTVPDLPPAPDLPEVPAAGPAYQVQVGDVLELRFFLNPELNQEVTVRPDGRFTTMLAPEVPAAGRTVPEITEELRLAYRRELRDPRPSVGVKSFAPARIYVGGEVAAPGEFLSVGPGLTLSQAIARAGGLKAGGSPERVFIIRRAPSGAGVVYATRYADVISGGDPAADVSLAPFDVVYVPKTPVAAAYASFNQYVQQFLPVTWGFSYVLNPSRSSSTVVQQIVPK